MMLTAPVIVLMGDHDRHRDHHCQQQQHQHQHQQHRQQKYHHHHHLIITIIITIVIVATVAASVAVNLELQTRSYSRLEPTTVNLERPNPQARNSASYIGTSDRRRGTNLNRVCIFGPGLPDGTDTNTIVCW